MNKSSFQQVVFGSLVFSLLFGLSFSSFGQLVIKPGAIDAEIALVDNFRVLRGPSVLHNDNYFVWGGSVLKGEDGKYHMFYSRWPAGPDHDKFGDGWLLSSEIAHAVSEYPDRDFEFDKVILTKDSSGNQTRWDAQSVHNPHIMRFDNKYYLYHTGTNYPGPQPAGSPGANLSKRNLIQQSQTLGVSVFYSLDSLERGEIIRSETPLLSPRTRVKPNDVFNPSPEGTETKPDNLIVVNPAMVYDPIHKKYLLIFKGNIYMPHWRGVHGIAKSDSPAGPFVPEDYFVFDVKDDEGKLVSAEDPYVWYHEDSKLFYAVFKDFSGRITGQGKGLAIMHSKDGEHWEKGENALFMPLELTLKSGEKVAVNRLERPQLLFDEDGLPIVLYAACAVDNPNPEKKPVTFNVQVPLNSSYQK